LPKVPSPEKVFIEPGKKSGRKGKILISRRFSGDGPPGGGACGNSGDFVQERGSESHVKEAVTGENQGEGQSGRGDHGPINKFHCGGAIRVKRSVQERWGGK